MPSLLERINKYLHYGGLLKYPRRLFKYFMYAIYPIVIEIWKIPSIKTIEETLLKIKDKKCSIARFGDGEVLYIVDKLNLPFQVYDERLANKLKIILKAELTGMIVGLPDGYRSIEAYERPIQVFWRSQISFTYPRFQKYLNLEKQYWNANITRLYYGFKDQSNSNRFFDLFRTIWEKRDVLLIEGEKSRLGMGNDLFASANGVERILGPAHNAYSRFDDLLNEGLKHDKRKLVLIALGPTAKALSYEFTRNGYQAIDIGNLDLEYEWYLMGAKERVKIEGKYTSEVKGGRNVAEANDVLYNEQIIKKLF